MSDHKQIRIRWTGPIEQEGVRRAVGPTDYGIYQVYGNHRIYGKNVLLYIGKAEQQTFGVRLPQHTDWFDWKEVGLEFYLGRILGFEHPKDTTDWDNQIQCAETALIQYCQPAWNSANLNTDNSTRIFSAYTVENFGSKRDLPTILNRNADLKSSAKEPEGLIELSNSYLR